MKRMLAVLLCLTLCLCACPALAGTYNGPTFSVRYDDVRFGLDQYSYLNSGAGKWFFVLYDGTYSVDCGMEYGDRGMGMTLRDAGEDALWAYADRVCQATGGSLMEIYTQGQQPFVIVSVQRPDVGGVYYAETVVGGAAVYLEIYNLSSGTVNSAAMSALKGILNGFSAR